MKGKPQTFDSRGFTFICGRSRRRAFLLRRHTRRDPMRAVLREIRDAMWRRRQDSLTDQGLWLRLVMTGYFAYHAMPTNAQAIGAYLSALLAIQSTFGHRSAISSSGRNPVENQNCTMARSCNLANHLGADAWRIVDWVTG